MASDRAAAIAEQSVSLPRARHAATREIGDDGAMTQLGDFIPEMQSVITAFTTACAPLNEGRAEDAARIREHADLAISKLGLLKKRVALHQREVLSEFQRAASADAQLTSTRTAAFGGRRKGVFGALNQGVRSVQASERAERQRNRAEFNSQCDLVKHEIDRLTIELRQIKAELPTW